MIFYRLTQEKPAPREKESMRQFVEGNNKLHDRRKRKNRSDNLEDEHDLKAQVGRSSIGVIRSAVILSPMVLREIATSLATRVLM